MSPSDFQVKLEQQVKKEWTELISSYGELNLKLFKSMQDVQSYREGLVRLDYTVERLYQAMCFFKFYKPTKNPVYEHPFDNPVNPLGPFSNQLKERFERYLSHGLRDIITDVISSQDYLGGMDAEEYLNEKIRYHKILENIFSEDVLNDVNPDSLSKEENFIIEVYSEYAKYNVQELIEYCFEDMSTYFGDIAENLYTQKLSTREKHCIEYTDKLKRMIQYELQLNDLRMYVERFYFLSLCVFKGKDLDVKDNFEVFQMPEPGNYDYHWWQNDPFGNEGSIERGSFDDESYGGFRKIMKSIFIDKITELQRTTDSKKELQYRYLLDRLNFEYLFK